MRSIPLDTSRLPGYSHSHMLRFHPYPRETSAVWDALEVGQTPFIIPTVVNDVRL